MILFLFKSAKILMLTNLFFFFSPITSDFFHVFFLSVAQSSKTAALSLIKPFMIILFCKHEMGCHNNPFLLCNYHCHKTSHYNNHNIYRYVKKIVIICLVNELVCLTGLIKRANKQKISKD